MTHHSSPVRARYGVSFVSSTSDKILSQSLYHSTLQWRHNERDGVSNHRPHDCLLTRLFRRRLKETTKPCVTGLCGGNSPVTDEFPAQGPVTQKMFPFDDVIMIQYIVTLYRVITVLDCIWCAQCMLLWWCIGRVPHEISGPFELTGERMAMCEFMYAVHTKWWPTGETWESWGFEMHSFCFVTYIWSGNSFCNLHLEWKLSLVVLWIANE